MLVKATGGEQRDLGPAGYDDFSDWFSSCLGSSILLLYTTLLFNTIALFYGLALRDGV